MAVHYLFRRRRPTALGLAALAATVAATVATTTLLWPEHHNAAPHQPRVDVADVSGRATACLATDTATATKSAEVTRIWNAMQAAGPGTSKNVQQLIEPATTSAQAQPYLAGLISQRCDLIVTVGPTFAQAIRQLAEASPATRFTAVDSALATAPANITLVTADQAAAVVQQQVQGLKRESSSHH